MSRIRSKDTSPERLVRSLLHRLGFRFRLHRKDLPGRPDILLPRYKVALFVHGCFWHRHEGCRYATTPGTNREFWQEKFARNVARDRENREALEALGWRVLVVWECETRDTVALAARLDYEIREHDLYATTPPDALLAAEEQEEYGSHRGRPTSSETKT